MWVIGIYERGTQRVLYDKASRTNGLRCCLLFWSKQNLVQSSTVLNGNPATVHALEILKEEFAHDEGAKRPFPPSSVTLINSLTRRANHADNN